MEGLCVFYDHFTYSSGLDVIVTAPPDHPVEHAGDMLLHLFNRSGFRTIFWYSCIKAVSRSFASVLLRPSSFCSEIH